MFIIICQTTPHRHVTMHSIIFQTPCSFISDDSKITTYQCNTFISKVSINSLK